MGCPIPTPTDTPHLSRAPRADSAPLVSLASAGTPSGSELWAQASPIIHSSRCPACQGSDEILEISWDRQSPAKLVFVLQPQGHRALC